MIVEGRRKCRSAAAVQRFQIVEHGAQIGQPVPRRRARPARRRPGTAQHQRQIHLGHRRKWAANRTFIESPIGCRLAALMFLSIV